MSALEIGKDGEWVRRGMVLVFVPAEGWDRNKSDVIKVYAKATAPADIRCGTLLGYRRHLRRKEPTCAPCKAANTAKAATYRPPPPELKPCGTWAAAARHTKRGEPLDEACRKASTMRRAKSKMNKLIREWN